MPFFTNFNMTKFFFETDTLKMTTDRLVFEWVKPLLYKNVIHIFSGVGREFKKGFKWKRKLPNQGVDTPVPAVVYKHKRHIK